MINAWKWLEMAGYLLLFVPHGEKKTFLLFEREILVVSRHYDNYYKKDF